MDRASTTAVRREALHRIWLHENCTVGSAIHEIGHAVGLWHEQSRQDRDSHVIVHWQNIQDGYAFNFEKLASMDVGIYDFGSIMQYNSFWFSKNGHATITKLDLSEITGQRESLSASDISAPGSSTPIPGPATI